MERHKIQFKDEVQHRENLGALQQNKMKSEKRKMKNEKCHMKNEKSEMKEKWKVKNERWLNEQWKMDNESKEKNMKSPCFQSTSGYKNLIQK